MANIDNPLDDWVRPHMRQSLIEAHDSGGAQSLPVSQARDRIRIDIVQDLAAIEPDWRQFENRAAMTVFQTYDWLAAWQRHVGSRFGARPAIVVGRDARQQIVFIVPLAVRRRFIWKILTWLGYDLSDYNAPLIDPAFAAAQPPGWFAALWPDILRQIRRTTGIDLVDFRKMPQTIANLVNPFSQLQVTENASRAHMASLADSWDIFYARRSSSTRQRDRSKQRRLAQNGEIRYIEPEDAADAAQTVAILVRQKSQALQRMGARNIFVTPGYCDFLQHLVEDPACRKFVHVSRLQVGDTAAAANLGLMFGDCYYHILMSYEIGEISRFGPGAVHLRELMQAAIRRGMKCFDFTIGDEPYKQEWCDRQLVLLDHIAAESPLGLPAVWGIRGFLATKYAVKNNASLWRLYTRARSFLGRLR